MTNFIPVLEIIYRIILHEKIYTPIQFLPGDLLDGVRWYNLYEPLKLYINYTSS